MTKCGWSVPNPRLGRTAPKARRSPRRSARAASLLAALWLTLALGLLAGGFLAVPAQAQSTDPEAKAAVEFMRTVIGQVNPSLSVEDAYCASALPWAIYSNATESDLDWRQVFALAWQESRFDCHAKSSKDRGGAFGPFQIRRVWESLVGDPRYRYYDPELAASRVVRVLRYYQDTDRLTELRKRGFRFPLLCLFNAGEAREVNKDYCKAVGRKMDVVRKGWSDFKAGRLVAISAN
jgi:hypothetical protein